MPNWLRILLVIVAAGVLALVLVGVLAVRWIKRHAPDLAERGKATQIEARKFGEGKQSSDCIDEGLRRSKASKDFFGMVESRLFVDKCLNIAKEPAGFCSDVPNGLLTGAKWANEECNKRGLAGDQGCAGVFQSVMAHCHPRR
jgi:hypothetical protein